MSANLEAVQFLLNCGADPNTLDTSGRNPVSNLIWEHVRTRPGKRDIEPDMMMVMHILVTAGTNLDGNR